MKNLSSFSTKTKAPVTPYNEHYRWCKIEALFVIEDWKLSFNLGSVLKYINRHGRKRGESPIVALKKARFYLDREISLLEEDSKLEEEATHSSNLSPTV